jgi:prolyl 4-hydroxylase
MKEDLDNSFSDIDLYKCFNSDAYNYTPDDYAKDIQVIIPGNLIIIDNFLSSEECDNILSLAENIGYKEAKFSLDGITDHLLKDIRDCGKCVVNDLKASDIIFERIRNILPYFNEGGILSSVYERFRILKYNKHGKFTVHMDGLNPRICEGYSERSVFTLHIYLNEGTCGGETIFYNDKWLESGGFKCAPKKGRIAIFRQTEFYHCGAEVEDGLKYTMRTDIMYRNINEKLFNQTNCQICKCEYQLYQCYGHVFPYCKCPNTLDSLYYCVTCNQEILTKNAPFG